MNEKIQYWIEISNYDLETAEAMHTAARYRYVGFMCHQTIEKIIKAVFVKIHNSTPPFIHSLNLLIDKSGIQDQLSESQLDFLDELGPLNLNTRYPAHKDSLYKLIDENKSIYYLENTKEFQKWLIKNYL
ncbi:HEPN domain-containing protein [Candidatus Kapabacteria bacterium]|nr:HEPN domain-containing protein [Candidatus Kapabacteria bacterium]